MSTQEQARELKELKIMREELEAEITALEDAIKATMGEQEHMTAGAYRITWKPVTTFRMDTAALRAELPDNAARYTMTSTVRRFVVA